MSSTGQTTSPTSFTFSIQLITNALADYAKITGVDLSKNPFAVTVEQSNTPEEILELLQEREMTFKQYRDGNRRLIKCLSPAVKVIQAFSGILGEAVSLVSHNFDLITFLLISLRQVPFSPAKALFVGIDVLLAVRLSDPSLSVSFVIYRYYRLPMGLHQATMLFLNSSSVWATFSSVWRSIPRSRPLP